MKTFTIDCSLHGVMRPLVFCPKNTYLPHIFIYDQQQWVGTIKKDDSEKYRIVSCGITPISITELEHIGNQIDLLQKAS